MHWIDLIHEFHNLSWITEINELFHDILIYWDAPVCVWLTFSHHSPPAGGTTWSSSFMLVLFQIFFTMALSSSFACSKLPNTNTYKQWLFCAYKLGCVLDLCMFINCICVYDTFPPSVLMCRAVRTRAKRVALNITVPSLLRGMFMDTSRCGCTDKVSQVMCLTHCRICTFWDFVCLYLACHSMWTKLSKSKRRLNPAQ